MMKFTPISLSHLNFFGAATALRDVDYECSTSSYSIQTYHVRQAKRCRAIKDCDT